MSECATCGNKIITCICPKELGGAEPDETDIDFEEKLDEISGEILEGYADLKDKDPNLIQAYIEILQNELGLPDDHDLIYLLADGITSIDDAREFKELFKALEPNLAMLEAVSNKLDLGVFPNPSSQLANGLQEAITHLGWDTSAINFQSDSIQEVLDAYGAYYQTLDGYTERQAIVSDIFWTQIQSIGTPIIEHNPDDPAKCNVYFLANKDALAHSIEKQGTKKDLYLQGDFHGYDSTHERSRLSELVNTGVMLKLSEIEKDAVITYRLVQLEPSLSNKSPVEHHGSAVIEHQPDAFFPEPGHMETPRLIAFKQTRNTSQQFWGNKNQVVDEYSTHRPTYFGAPTPERIFKVNSEPGEAHIDGKEVAWKNLFSFRNTSEEADSHFEHKMTMYSMTDGRLEQAGKSGIRADAGFDELFSQKDDSPYANCTRAIQVFTPTSREIDRLIIVNDGMAYLGQGGMERFEDMVQKGSLSPNTAFVCITPLPPMKDQLSKNDPKADMPGMGERTVEYEHRIDEYAVFIRDQLLPSLKTEGFDVPENPNARMMIGSSLSGTAGIYIGSKYPDVVGSVVAQSPSPSSREILEPVVRDYDSSAPRAHIELSCGEYECAGFADNTNLPFNEELAEKLELTLSTKPHGHQHVAWIEELEQSIPKAFDKVADMRPLEMPKKAAVEILIYKPDPDNARPAEQRGVMVNPHLQNRFDQFVPIGVYLEGSDLNYYFFDQCDNSPKIYNDWDELKQDLPEGLGNLFENNPKLFIMGHGHGGYYGLGNMHGPSEQIYDDNFDKLLSEFKQALPDESSQLFVTLEGCNTDSQLGANATHQEKTFLERVSVNHPEIIFGGTGPWNYQEVETGFRSLASDLPVTSMAGNIWKSGSSVIFHHNEMQAVVRKSLFASTQTASELKVNTIEYVRATLGEDSHIERLREIALHRDILKIEDLTKVEAFPELLVKGEVPSRFVEQQKQILEKEQNNYLTGVREILECSNPIEQLSDRDVLKLTLGLSESSIFKGHEELLESILENRSLLPLLMVSCGKTLIGGPSNDGVIDLLLAQGADINSTDEKGMTALHYAAQNFYNYRKEPLNLINKLLTCGANLEAQNVDGQTPVETATEHSKDGRVTGSDGLLASLQHSNALSIPLELQQAVRKIFKMSAHMADELLSLPGGKREYITCSEGTLYMPEDAIEKLHELLQPIKESNERLSEFKTELSLVITDLIKGNNTGQVLNDGTDEIEAKCFMSAKESLSSVMNTLDAMNKEVYEAPSSVVSFP